MLGRTLPRGSLTIHIAAAEDYRLGKMGLIEP
jgi:hypothetical protein